MWFDIQYSDKRKCALRVQSVSVDHYWCMPRLWIGWRIASRPNTVDPINNLLQRRMGGWNIRERTSSQSILEDVNRDGDDDLGSAAIRYPSFRAGVLQIEIPIQVDVRVVTIACHPTPFTTKYRLGMFR